MGQGNERLLVITTLPTDVATHLVVAALVAMLGLQSAEDLHGGVTLLGWRILISEQDGVDNRVEGAEYGSGRQLASRVGLGLYLGECLTDLAPRVMEGAGDSAICIPPASL